MHSKSTTPVDAWQDGQSQRNYDDIYRASVVQSEEEEISAFSRQSLALNNNMDAFTYGGNVRKKPYAKNFAIGYPRQRYIVLNSENKFSWYTNYSAYENNRPPLGSICISSNTKIEINDHDDYFRIIPEPGIKPLELESTDLGQRRDDWIEVIRGRVKILRNRQLATIKEGIISILHASTIEGKAIIKTLLASPSSFASINLIVTDETDLEELQEFVNDEELNIDPQIRETISISKINSENIESSINIFQRTDIAIITRPELDWEEKESILSNYISVLETAEVPFTILTSSMMATLPNSSEGKVFAAIEMKIKESMLSYSILRLPFLMENLLAYSDDILENSHLSLPISNEIDFTVLALDDYAKTVVHMIYDLKNHAGKTYRLTAPLVTINDFMNIIEGYTNQIISYDRISYDEFVNKKIADGFFRWKMIEQKEYFELVDHLSLIVSNQTDDFVDIVRTQPLSLPKWIVQNKKMFVSEDLNIFDADLRSSIIKRRNSALEKTENKFGLRRPSSTRSMDFPKGG